VRVLLVSNRPDFGGIGIYVNNLAAGLVAHGVEVGWLYAGEYDVWPGTYVRAFNDPTGVRHFSLRNSPNVHPASARVDPADESGHPTINREFSKVMRTFRPQIVHFHDLGGLCASLIQIASERVKATIVSHHNYWFMCPRNELLRVPKLDLCALPGREEYCGRCRATLPGAKHVRSRLRLGWAARTLIPDSMRAGVRRMRDRCRRSPQIDFAVSDYDALSHQSHAAIYRQRNEYNRFLLSERCTLNLAVSSCTRGLLEDWGVPPERIVTMHIGSKAAEMARPFRSDCREGVTFGYIGPLAPHKGAHVLVKAFNSIDANLDARLLIYGDRGSGYVRKLKEDVTRKGVHFRPPYLHTDLPKVLEEIDCVVVPPIWYDNAPQVVFEAISAGVPVIGARIGGIPDFVRDQENGLLFLPGDDQDLANKILAVASDRSLLKRLQSKAQPTKGMEQHVKELVTLYQTYC
jgi:glycosyltransferase involved in cell wall biosynthesis